MDSSTAAQLNGSWPHYGRWCGSHNGTLWNIDSGSASVHFDVEGADHLAPLLGFFSDELCEVGGRARQRLAEVSQTDLHLGVGEGRVDLLVELLDDLGWRVPGNADAIPRRRLVARHEFSHSGDIR